MAGVEGEKAIRQNCAQWLIINFTQEVILKILVLQKEHFSFMSPLQIQIVIH